MTNYDIALWLAGCLGFTTGLGFWLYLVWLCICWRGR